jgi:hypothetical protein
MAVTARWSAAGWPEAVVVTTSYVWVAGTDGAQLVGQPLLANANQVQQFDLNGSLVHTYTVDTPTALAGDGDTVWVVYGPGPGGRDSLLAHLHDGVADPPTTLSSAGDPQDSQNGNPLVVCPDGVYAATSTPALVDHIQNGRIVGHVGPLTGYYSPVLTCAPTRGVVIVATARTLETDRSATSFIGQRLFTGTQAVGPTITLPDSANAIGAGSAVVWLQGEHGYSAIDKNLAPVSAPVTVSASRLVPADMPFYPAYAVGGDTLWLLACTDAPANVCHVVGFLPS